MPYTSFIITMSLNLYVRFKAQSLAELCELFPVSRLYELTVLLHRHTALITLSFPQGIIFLLLLSVIFVEP